MKYVILGGGGSFGLTVSKYLLEQEETELVVGIGRNPPKQECFHLNVGEDDPRYRYHALHIGNEFDLLLPVLNELHLLNDDLVYINFAAQGEGAVSDKHQWRYYDTNICSLVRLCEWLHNEWWWSKHVRHGHFIHIGSSEVYGPNDSNLPHHEGCRPNPTSVYANSKLAFDNHLQIIGERLGFSYTILRPSNCYGPGQQLHRLIPKAVLYGLTGRRLPLHGGGLSEKSFIHTRDLARAIHLIVKRYAEGRGVAGIYNVGPEQPTAVRRVVELVSGVLGIPFEQLCEVTGDRAHNDSRYWLDSSKIRNLGWTPWVDWQEGLGTMERWVRKYLPQLSKLSTEFVMRA